MERQEQYLQIFAGRIREILQRSGVLRESLQEVRLREGKPLLAVCAGREWALSGDGRMLEEARWGYRVRQEDLQGTLECLSGYSLYAFDQEIRQGYITVSGGHRVGLAGRVLVEDGRIRAIRPIAYLNVRFAHQVLGCADEVLPHVIEDGEVCDTLIISPPRCGKTTLLRDLIRQISDGSAFARGKTVGVVDERSELGGACLGIAQNDLGIRTDVLECCPKAEGMMMLLRSMSPQVIAVDEIGGERDGQAISAVLRCGCRLLATVHGASLEDVRQKPVLGKLIRERTFERYVLLRGGGEGKRRCAVLDGRGTRIYGDV